VLQPALEDYYVRYEVCAYTRLPNQLHLIEADLRRHIQDKFFEAGVEICSPAFTALRDGNAPAIPLDALRTAQAGATGDQAAVLRDMVERKFRVQT
jgi:small-conductance mechanosensitive channel